MIEYRQKLDKAGRPVWRAPQVGDCYIADGRVLACVDEPTTSFCRAIVEPVEVPDLAPRRLVYERVGDEQREPRALEYFASFFGDTAIVGRAANDNCTGGKKYWIYRRVEP